jgi:argininosuccinate lyase
VQELTAKLDFAKQKDIKPLDFPYSEAKRIYAEMVKGSEYAGELPMVEAEFKSTLDPVAINKNRASVGGPQPVEMACMLKLANQSLAVEGDWIKAKRSKISASLAKLDTDSGKIAPAQ